VFPKIYIGKANPVSEGELTYLLEKLPEMQNDEVKEVLVGMANRRNVAASKIEVGSA